MFDASQRSGRFYARLAPRDTLPPLEVIFPGLSRRLAMSRKLWPWLVLLLLWGGSAFAAETGSLSGTVRSGDGAPLPGVRVMVAGPLLPAGRSATTAADGGFDFQRLPPGTYEVSAALEGMGNAKREAIVALDKDTRLELVLKATLAEAITVSAAAPVIDVKSAEVE